MSRIDELEQIIRELRHDLGHITMIMKRMAEENERLRQMHENPAVIEAAVEAYQENYGAYGKPGKDHWNALCAALKAAIETVLMPKVSE